MRLLYRSLLFWIFCAGFMLGCGDRDPGLCAEVSCPEGMVCYQGYCVSGADPVACEPSCPSGETCVQGRCLSESGGCDYQGQSCSRQQFGAYLDDHLCMDWSGDAGRAAVCSQDCRSQACPDDGTCFLVTVQGQACESDDACFAGQFCYQGGCAFAACRPSECSEVGGVDPHCGAGTRCEKVGEARLCVPAGSRGVGEACVDAGLAFEENRSDEACVEGASCVAGRCRELCEGVCDGNEECIQVGGGVEVCASSCVPGARECEDGETCVPAEEVGGICQPAGTTPLFAACTAGGEPCVEGAICALEESGLEFGRCLPSCNLGAAGGESGGELSREAQAARDQTCPQGEPEVSYLAVWHLGGAAGAFDLYLGESLSVEATLQGGDLELAGEGFAEIRPGRIRWKLRRAGEAATDSPVVEGESLLAAGERYLLVMVPRAGTDEEIDVYLVEVEGDGPLFLQAIPDLEPVDLWIRTDSSDELIEENLAFLGLVSLGGHTGGELVLAEPGAGPESALLVYEESVLEGRSLVASTGTVDPWDLHGTSELEITSEVVPSASGSAGLAFTCRAVNGGTVGACLQRCDEGSPLELGRCDGEAMGCGPRFYEARNRWRSVCQPVGARGEGEGCNPQATNPCNEGLYCQEYGNGAVQGAAGICVSLCELGEESCGDGETCRAIAAGTDYLVGECRVACDPGQDYADPICPEGQRSCRPEATLIPAGDGVSTGYSLREETPVCWASGTTPVGQACAPGNCEAGSECIFERSIENDFVGSLLSPYFPGGDAFPTCRPICDPFTCERGNSCGEEETCLFNYPWNARVGHCAPIAEQRGPGESCESPGLACGADSICVLEEGVARCTRFCQFEGPATTGYRRSTCPQGYQCGPFARDIGVCRLE